ncbi:hypothetical protein [Falsiroseomonas selenitidurans]|uniref:Uncharacterized protein n=1 Tax=Falsiroseomonas selenitidurans TaxID=2716335 RepID=A0ABX1E9M6_9PROT|nr:hypothetical protein [Falsiroseomonas selenitidurans]NKC33480.1 hypothetical protein [Falsiroseomonas selenitidurans]
MCEITAHGFVPGMVTTRYGAALATEGDEMNLPRTLALAALAGLALAGAPRAQPAPPQAYGSLGDVPAFGWTALRLAADLAALAVARNYCSSEAELGVAAEILAPRLLARIEAGVPDPRWRDAVQGAALALMIQAEARRAERCFEARQRISRMAIEALTP